MKKLIFAVVLALLSFGCKSTSATATKVDQKSAHKIDGNWVLDKVTNPGADYINVTSFQIADSRCFEGSKWKFVSNNNKGTMTLNASSGCPALSSPITWFLNDKGEFVLKILEPGAKSKEVRNGFVLGIANQTATSFELIDKVDVAGKQSDVVYHFTKS